MANRERELKIVEPFLNKEAEIGRWLWAFQDTRKSTLEQLDHLSPGVLDWLPPDGESSIGTILYHIANIEADWLYVEVLEQPTFPAEVAGLFPFETRDKQGYLSQALG